MKRTALVLLLVAPAGANTGASFLRIDPTARTAAMGGASAAGSASADAAFFNPAGLAALPKKELMAGHAAWLADTSFDALAVGVPLKGGGLAFSALRLSAGSLEGRTADRRTAGSFEASDAAYALSAARSLSGLSAGVTLKLLRSQLGEYTAQTEAVDLGLRKDIPGKPLSVGFSVRNLGPGYRFLDQRDPLPLIVSAGASLRLAGVLGLACDLRHEPYDRRTSVSVGTEYSLLGMLSLRAGLGAGSLKRTAGPGMLGGLGAGLGLKLGSFGVDYSFTPFGELGAAQRLSLSARL